MLYVIKCSKLRTYSEVLITYRKWTVNIGRREAKTAVVKLWSFFVFVGGIISVIFFVMAFS